MKSKWYVLLVIIFMYLPVSIDATVLYVVAPVLSTQLQASHHQLLWIMDIYPLIMAALLLPMGSFGDRIGYKKMAIAGSMVFGIASAGAAFSQSPELLIAARALAGYLINSFGIRMVAVSGLAVSALSLYMLSDINFGIQATKAWLWMTLLGAGDTVALMASSSAIMSAAPVHKASSAGSIEGMSYELGNGLGITIFGSVLAGVYSSTVRLPEHLPESVRASAGASLSEAVEAARHLDEGAREALLTSASSAFMHSHNVMLESASLILMVLMIMTFFIFKQGNAVSHS